MERRINYYCPECRSEDLARCFCASRELWGWSDYCRSCGWYGHAPHWIDRSVPSQFDAPREREPFTNWPNGMGE